MPRQQGIAIENTKQKEYLRQWYLERKDIYREKHLQKSYGMSLQDFFDMLEEQNYECAICSADLSNAKPKNIHIDHCHTSSKVRGILCNSCNMGIGMLKDDVDVLKSAIAYLEYHNA